MNNVIEDYVGHIKLFSFNKKNKNYIN
jgi:hypothetical protein